MYVEEFLVVFMILFDHIQVMLTDISEKKLAVFLAIARSMKFYLGSIQFQQLFNLLPGRYIDIFHIY